MWLDVDGNGKRGSESDSTTTNYRLASVVLRPVRGEGSDYLETVQSSSDLDQGDIVHDPLDF